ncbi:MAG: hypothetical protein A2X52_04000 [Candidatus Rokubacteria bacterium GWC2_70_16]|nr:MAG: hypothetical protein A2X52_04000 [Candidatus Rokubacteria bacterium GWC2_70_16]
MTMGRLPPGPVSLREAAVRIFALIALLPVLLLVFLLVLLLQRPDLVTPLQLQVSLLLAFLSTSVGFVAFYRMVAQIARIADATGAATTGDGAPATAAVQPPTVPGLGQIAEIGQMGTTLSRMLEDLRTSTVRLEDQVLKSSTLNELVELTAKVPRIQDLLALVLERTMRAVSATIGSIMLLDRERQRLRVAAARGLPEGALAGAEVRVGEGIAGTVAAGGEPVLVEDIETDPRFARVNDPRYGSGSFICLPIRVEERVIGVINLAKKQHTGGGPHAVRAFTASDLQFLNTLMGYIAYALDNARLLQEARDTADRLQEAVDELRATQARLVQGETLRAMGQLASGMAHHLNNLLMVVSTRIQLLARRLDDPETRGALDIAERAIRDAAEVVSRVRRFARAEQPVSDVAAVDLNQLCREVAELTQPRWRDQSQACGIPVELSLDLAEIGLVAGEPGPLREVLINLVLNAVDAMPHGGAIALRTWDSAHGVHCSVSDTGTGMSEEVRRRALEPFFTTKGSQGMGLGLSVIHGTIQRHGGELTLESGEGKGTVVTIRLPRRAAGAPVPAAGDAPPTPLPPHRVLLIDDQPEVRAGLADLLRADGHGVLEAGDGPEALARLEAGEEVDVVLTDLGMPGMTGRDVARAIRARWPGLRVGLVTGWTDEVETASAEHALLDFVLAKPIDRQALRLALASLPRGPAPARQ